eukprot:10580635-Alexandrium_andersonii.AAC.1
MADKAKHAASAHDSRTAYAIVRQLSRRQAPKPPMLKALDGATLATNAQVAKRWPEFFADCHGGKIGDM